MSNAIDDARSARCLFARPEDAPLFIEKRFHRELQYRTVLMNRFFLSLLLFLLIYSSVVFFVSFLEFMHRHREYGYTFVIAPYTVDHRLLMYLWEI